MSQVKFENENLAIECWSPEMLIDLVQYAGQRDVPVNGILTGIYDGGCHNIKWNGKELIRSNDSATNLASISKIIHLSQFKQACDNWAIDHPAKPVYADSYTDEQLERFGFRFDSVNEKQAKALWKYAKASGMIKKDRGTSAKFSNWFNPESNIGLKVCNGQVYSYDKFYPPTIVTPSEFIARIDAIAARGKMDKQ